MAYMFPEKPREFDEYSGEGAMFELLEGLPKDYYVFHSVKILLPQGDNILQESETDFYVFHPQKGMIALEAKAGAHIKYDGSNWRYGNGDIMHNDGPFRQAQKNSHNIVNYIKFKQLFNLLRRCIFTHAVWFPDMERKKFIGKDLPPECDLRLLWTTEDNDDLVAAIDRVFSVKVNNAPDRTAMSEDDVNILLNRIMAPKLDLISVTKLEAEHHHKVFKRMLKEQIALLNYIEEQKTAVISGMAGTGKTVMAIKKGELHAEKGEKVLFLCYNAMLRDFLRANYGNEFLDIMNIDTFGAKLCGDSFSATTLASRLDKYSLDQDFPYQHVIIDEGQDFDPEKYGRVFDLLKTLVVDEDIDGSFYLFYDKNQRVQSESLPEYITEADCKLTLYRNCRNTENIAITSSRLLNSDKPPKLIEGFEVGDNPDMFFVAGKEECKKAIDYIVNQCNNKGFSDIQILTCKTESSSIVKPLLQEGKYKYGAKQIPFTTCRKYKGLEADIIIMVDLDEESYKKDPDYIYYVGASRARHRLYIINSFGEDQCREILERQDIKKKKNFEKALADRYNSNHVNKDKYCL